MPCDGALAWGNRSTVLIAHIGSTPFWVKVKHRSCRPATGRIATGARAVTASAARIAKEDANRKELAEGVLGLDLYNLRPKLAQVEYISYAEYAKRAGEGVYA